MEEQPNENKQKFIKIAVFGAIFVGMVAWKMGAFQGFSKSGSSSSSLAMSSEDEALSSKLNPFIECMNRVDSTLRTNYQRYGDMFARRTSEDQNAISIVSFSSFKIAPYETNNDFTRECAEKLEKAATEKPSDEKLDAAGKTYAATLRELIPVMNDVDSYYKQENYRDDNMQKGKELNAQLNPKFEKLFATSDDIHKSIDVHTLTLRQNELNAMEKDNGRDFEWHTVNLAHQARLALDALNEQVEKETLSVETVTELEKKYEAAFTEAKAYADKNPDQKTSLGNKPRWFSINSNFENILKAIRTLRRDMAESKPVEAINGDLERVSREYNSMIRSYNMHARLAR